MAMKSVQVFTYRYVKIVHNKSLSLSRCFLCLHAYFPADHGLKLTAAIVTALPLDLVMRSICRGEGPGDGRGSNQFSGNFGNDTYVVT